MFCILISSGSRSYDAVTKQSKQRGEILIHDNLLSFNHCTYVEIVILWKYVYFFVIILTPWDKHVYAYCQAKVFLHYFKCITAETGLLQDWGCLCHILKIYTFMMIDNQSLKQKCICDQGIKDQDHEENIWNGVLIKVLHNRYAKISHDSIFLQFWYFVPWNDYFQYKKIKQNWPSHFPIISLQTHH